MKHWIALEFFSRIQAMTILIFLCFAISGQLFASEIQNIRFGEHPDKTRIVIDFTGDTDFQAMVLNNPRRLQIMMMDRDVSRPPRYNPIPPFDTITFTKNNDFHVMTLPLSEPAKIISAFVIEGEPSNRLVVDVETVSETTFLNHLHKQHGPLQGLKSVDDMIIPPARPKKHIIMIDAGHGGVDPGAVSQGGIREKDITLSIAKKLADHLNKTGYYDARLTRETDKFIRLYDRVKMARQAEANLFLSIHADSLRGGYTLSGASVYTLSTTASDAQTAALMTRENAADSIGGFDAGVADEAVNAILIDLAMEDTMIKSKSMANYIINGLRGADVQTIRGPHRYAGFAVLKGPDVPSVLIETGFLSNEQQAQDLTTPETQSKIVKGITTAINNYFDIDP